MKEIAAIDKQLDEIEANDPKNKARRLEVQELIKEGKDFLAKLKADRLILEKMENKCS